MLVDAGVSTCALARLETLPGSALVAKEEVEVDWILGWTDSDAGTSGEHVETWRWFAGTGGADDTEVADEVAGCMRDSRGPGAGDRVEV